MPVERPDSAEEAAARTTVAQAASLLAGRNADIPQDFLAALYQRAGAEDLLRYSADDLAAIGADSFRFLSERKAAAPNIRFEVTKPQNSELKAVGLIEIVNDDMPFLVD